MAVGSIAGVGIPRIDGSTQTSDKIQLLEARQSQPIACATVAIKSSISFDALILNIIYQLSSRAQ